MLTFSAALGPLTVLPGSRLVFHQLTNGALACRSGDVHDYTFPGNPPLTPGGRFGYASPNLTDGQELLVSPPPLNMLQTTLEVR